MGFNSGFKGLSSFYNIPRQHFIGHVHKNCTTLSSLTGNQGQYRACEIANTCTTQTKHSRDKILEQEIRTEREKIEKRICPTMHGSVYIFCLDYLSLVIFLENSIRRKEILREIIHTRKKRISRPLLFQ